MKEEDNDIKLENTTKEEMFRKLIKQYEKAKKNSFYLESLWILYAMIEDRSSAYFYHLGFTDISRKKVIKNKKIKKQVRIIFEMVEKREKYRFDTLNGKLSRINKVINWSNNASEELTDYQKKIKQAIDDSTDESFLNAVEYLNGEWREKRNQLTHSLFNKEYEIMNDELKELIEKGYLEIRVFDKAVSKIKRKKLRDKFNIQ